MKVKKGLIFGGIGLLALIVLGSRMGKKPPVVAEKPLTVTTSDIESKVIETGEIEAETVVEVKSKVSGRVDKLLVDEGDVVKKGQLVAVIDPQETQLKVQQDRAQLRGAQASTARSSVELQQKRITAQTAYKRAQARVDQLSKELGIQPTLTRLSIDTAKSNYVATQHDYDRLVNTTQPNETLEANNLVKQSQTGYEVAQSAYDRESKLFQEGYSSKQDVENAQNQLKQAEVNLSNAKDRLARLAARQAQDRRNAQDKVVASKNEFERNQANSIQDVVKRKDYETAITQLDDARAGLHDVEALAATRAQNQASVDQIQGGLNDSLRLLGETEIRAPMDGVVSKKLVQQGELVASLSSFSSGTPLVRIEDRSSMIVKLDINEIDIAHVEVNMPAQIRIDAFPGKTFAGVIKKIAPSSNTTTASTTDTSNNAGKTVVKYRVEIRITDKIPGIKSGMNASCTVITDSKKGVITVPVDYVEQTNGEFFVYPNGTKTKVKVGVQSASSMEILSGIKKGDELKKPPYTGPARKGANFGGGGG